MKSFHQLKWGISGLVALALLACGGEKDKEESKGPAAVDVVVTQVKAQPFEDWRNYAAEIRGIDDAMLNAGAGGHVQSVADVGTRVKQGQALCDIESDRFRALMLQADASLKLAKGEQERTKVNVEKGSLGTASLDQAELQVQGAKVGYLQAKRAYDDSRCLTPFNGVLVSKQIQKFSSVPPGAPTVRVARLDKVEAVFSIPESDAAQLEEKLDVEFTSLSGTNGEETFKGHISELDRAVDSRNRTLTVIAELNNTGESLIPGQVGNVRVLVRTYPEAVSIPSQAIIRLASGTFAMIESGGKAVQKTIVLGPAQGNSILVLSGLKPGDMLITSGSFLVTEGTPVKAKKGV